MYLWEDDVGDIHTIRQGEGGEQGDALMPFCLPLANTVHSPQSRRTWKTANIYSRSWTTSTPQALPTEWDLCMLFSRNTCTVTPASGSKEGKRRCGIKLDACDVLERIAQESDLQARVWKGPGLPEEKQGMKVLGAPLGHPSFVEAFLVKKIEDQRTLLDRIPLLADLQASWLLVLHCAARANYLLRVVEPGRAVR